MKRRSGVPMFAVLETRTVCMTPLSSRMVSVISPELGTRKVPIRPQFPPGRLGQPVVDGAGIAWPTRRSPHWQQEDHFRCSRWDSSPRQTRENYCVRPHPSLQSGCRPGIPAHPCDRGIHQVEHGTIAGGQSANGDIKAHGAGTRHGCINPTSRTGEGIGACIVHFQQNDFSGTSKVCTTRGERSAGSVVGR